VAWLQTVAVYTTAAVGVMALHEATHLAIARLAGPYSVHVHSWIPIRLYLDFEHLPSAAIFRVIALAPLLVGFSLALLGIQVGVWRSIRTTGPFYSHIIVVAYWLLYIAPSPADLRLALWPPTHPRQAVPMPE
jgi:hypothetical protein